MNGNTYLADFAIATTMILGITMLIFYLLGQDRIREFLLDTGEKMTLRWDKVRGLLFNFSVSLTPKPGTELNTWYENFLMLTKYNVKSFFVVKNILFSIVTIFFIAVAITDSNLGIDKIYKSFEYVDNPLFNENAYSEDEKKKIIEQKNYLFEYIDENAGFSNLLLMGQDVSVGIIVNWIEPINETGIEEEILAEEIYQKIVDYNKFKKIDFLGAMLKGLIAYILPELCIFLVNFFNKSSERAEKRFMKRLIIMNGSIKPTDFMMVLAELIDKSKYYKKILQEIEDSNKKNYEENTKIYQKYIQDSKDLETKLFFEKLDEANNYDFDQAILNIKNEFNLDKRMQTRKVKKMVESIHVWGLLGFMGLICIIIMYLLMPWLDTYQLGALM